MYLFEMKSIFAIIGCENFPSNFQTCRSLQETVYKMATAVLDNHADIQGIEITTPNVHFYRWDTEQFGLKNDNAVFQSTVCSVSERAFFHAKRGNC